LTRRLFQSTGTAGIALLAGLTVGTLPPDRATVGFDSSGLTALRYGSTEFLASGQLQVNGVSFRAPGGTTAGDLTATQTVDQAAQRITRTYRWGSVAATYHAEANRIEVGIVVTNRHSLPLAGIALEPLSIKLPSAPPEYDGVTPMMAYDPGQPGVLPLTHSAGTVVLTNDDIVKPVLIGFPWSSNRPAGTVYPLRVNTQPDSAYPTVYPRVTRPIAPGASDEFKLSLRFGGRGSTATQLASDAYVNFARVFPAQLKWTDKRPIGQLVLATTDTGWATNPRGWLLDPKIDVTTTEGLVAFRTRILAWADNSIAILKQMNAQGMIAWDIEGEQFRQPTTYLCDPRVLPQAAPEMEPIADAFFRPQRLELVGTSRASQESVADPTQLMIDKIAYAKKRWGASLFYIDSNGDPNLPIDAGVFQRVLAAHPDVLLIPEHENTRYYAYSAPYREMRQRQVATPAAVRLMYPNAFGATYVADGDFNLFRVALTRAVQLGDVMLTRGWYPDPANPMVESIYRSTNPRTPGR
jgi:hypothetical protein